MFLTELNVFTNMIYKIRIGPDIRKTELNVFTNVIYEIRLGRDIT